MPRSWLRLHRHGHVACIDTHCLFPFCVIEVLDEEGHGASYRVAEPHAGEDAYAVLLDVHAATPPVARLPAGEVAVDVRRRKRHHGRDAVDDSDNGGPV
jgi:hypothetical protein